MTFSRDQILAMAPDSASIKAADKLVNPAQWPRLQFNEQAIWGECQGSGANPYQSRIDLNGPAFKCSCPSRKFPCKHGLALFLLYLDRQDKFTRQDEAPEWVSDWLQSRDAKAQQQSSKAADNPKPVDEAARAKRQQQRQARVEGGIDDLQRWLLDLARVGLGELRNRKYQYWENLSARLVDAQATGLASRIRALGDSLMQAAPHGDIAAQVGSLTLLVEAASRLPQMPSDLQQDIRGLIGWGQSQEEVLSQPGLDDRWQVLRHHLQQQDKLIRQEIVLYGSDNQRYARLIQYAHSTQRTQLLQGWSLGHCYQARAHFFTSRFPLRALMADSKPCTDNVSPPTGCTLQEMIGLYQQQLQQQPWLGEVPFVLAGASATTEANGVWLTQNGFAVPLQLSERQRWQLLALTGPEPAHLSGEWNGEWFTPYGVWTTAGYQDVAFNALGND